MTKPRYRPDAKSAWKLAPLRSLIECQRIVNGWVPGDDDDDEPAVPAPPVGFYSHPSRRRTAPEQPRMYDGIQTTHLGSQRKADRAGFSNLGEFANLVKAACHPEGGSVAIKANERLRNALAQYGSEGVGADGGYLVPPDFRATLLQKVTGEDSLLSRCDQVPTGNGSVVVPKDEAAPWSATGIRAFWEGEAKAMPQSRPVLETSTVKLHKLTAFVPVTDELLEDAPGLTGYLGSKAAEVIDFRVTDAIVNGTGIGMPLGVLNAAHRVAQAKESSQVAATVHGLNLVRMWARMPAGWRRRAVWLCHPDVEPQLAQAGLQITNAAGTVTVGGSLTYIAAGGIADSPYGALFGRPVIPAQACQALGTEGDLIFGAFDQYGAFLRETGIRQDVSIHMFFDQGVTAFRFSLRNAGKPWRSAPLTAKHGSTTYSAFVTLATRG